MVETIFSTLFVLCFVAQPLAVLAGLLLLAWPTKPRSHSAAKVGPLVHGHV